MWGVCTYTEKDRSRERERLSISNLLPLYRSAWHSKGRYTEGSNSPCSSSQEGGHGGQAECCKGRLCQRCSSKGKASCFPLYPHHLPPSFPPFPCPSFPPSLPPSFPPFFPVQAIYERLFQFVLKRINQTVEVSLPEGAHSTVISVLDIYGFEVFGVNRSVWFFCTTHSCPFISP